MKPTSGSARRVGAGRAQVETKNRPADYPAASTKSASLQLIRGRLDAVVIETPAAIYVSFDGARPYPFERAKLYAFTDEVAALYCNDAADERPIELTGSHLSVGLRIERTGGVYRTLRLEPGEQQ